MTVQNFNQKLYAGGAAAFLLLLLLGLGFTQKSSPADHFTISKSPGPPPRCRPGEPAEERNDGLLEHVFNATLGVGIVAIHFHFPSNL